MCLLFNGGKWYIVWFLNDNRPPFDKKIEVFMQVTIQKSNQPITGNIQIPGDKSFSHRSIMFGAIAEGQTTVSNLLEGEDVLRTVAAFQAMGVKISKNGDTWQVNGAGLHGLKSPTQVLDMGNSGTTTRLLMGILAGQKFNSFLSGDNSLNRRDMTRLQKPYGQFGVRMFTSQGKLPAMIEGDCEILPINYKLPIASAQVKSSLLLMGLYADAATTVIEPKATRDYTEKLLNMFGATVVSEPQSDNSVKITLQPHARLSGQDLIVPKDSSSAAFIVAYAVLKEGSDITIEKLDNSFTRTGFYRCLEQMGANIEYSNQSDTSGVPVVDLRVRHSQLQGINVDADEISNMIDEIPILSVVASFANGTTTIPNLEELTHKESDRLQGSADIVNLNGGKATILDNYSLQIQGQPTLNGGGTIKADGDHRMAMSAVIAGLVSENGVTVDDISHINTSFPNFFDVIKLDVK